MKITKEQQRSLQKVFQRNLGNDKVKYHTYLQIRRAITPMFFGDGAVVIDMGNIWLAIEMNGHIHS